MDTIWMDIRFGLRTLGKNPGFATVAVLSLALGIGANTALFSLVNALLLRHLPVERPEQLAAVGMPSRVGGVSEGTPQFGLFSLPLYYALRDANQSFSGLLATGRTEKLDLHLEGAPPSSEPEHPRGRMVTGNYFSVLGVRAAAGRTFTDDDDRPGGVSAPAVVLSYQYWQRRFALDAGIVGKRLTINGGVFTVVGVAAPEFEGEVVGSRADLWLPVNQQPLVDPGRNWLNAPNTSWLLLMGRRKPGVSLEQAQAELDPLAHRLVQTLPGVHLDPEDTETLAKFHVAVSPGGMGFSAVRARFSQPLFLLFGMVGVVLLICCANIANLMLTRAAGRTREIGVRLAIGAGRARLVRQMFTECLLLALGGTAFGALLAAWGTRLLLQFASFSSDPIPLNVEPDFRVLGFTLSIAILTAMLFGLAPALRALRVDLLTALKPAMGRSGQAAASGGKFRIGKALVIAQVAVSLVLLAGAGLLARSLGNLFQQDVGFDRDHLLEVETDPVAGGYADKQLNTVMTQAAAALAELPGVTGVVTSYNGLFSGTESETLLGTGDLKRTSRDDRLALYDQVGPDYFQTIGAHILRGRGVGPQDTESSQKVAVIGSRMADHLYPGVDPIGHYLQSGDTDHPTPLEIVGVVSDIKEGDLPADAGRRFFVPILQRRDEVGFLRFLIRTPGDPRALRAAVRTRLAERYPNLKMLDISPVGDLMRQDLTAQRLLAQLALFFGGLALILAVTGLYGVMSYNTSLRTNEIGIRMALGAEGSAVLRMVLSESAVLLAAGVGVGLLLAFATLRILSSRLYGVSASDPLTFVGAVGVLGAAVLVAGYLPARRASRVDPLVALREE